jgi:hypothetical protein
MNSIIRGTCLRAKIRAHDLSSQNQECKLVGRFIRVISNAAQAVTCSQVPKRAGISSDMCVHRHKILKFSKEYLI